MWPLVSSQVRLNMRTHKEGLHAGDFDNWVEEYYKRRDQVIQSPTAQIANEDQEAEIQMLPTSGQQGSFRPVCGDLARFFRLSVTQQNSSTQQL